MGDIKTNLNNQPQLNSLKQDGGGHIALSGDWTLNNLTKTPQIIKSISQSASNNVPKWDLQSVTVIDNAVALLLWQAWGHKMPDNIAMKPEHRRLFDKWQQQPLPAFDAPRFSLGRAGACLAGETANIFRHLQTLITLLGQMALDCFYLLRHPGDTPWDDISITVYDSGVRALGITALVGFLIGIVLSYLSALQLKIFGAEIYIIDILGMSIIRELGPLLAAILVAGRSGSAMTAQIGIMRVTEELDALSALGISHSLRLVFPKVMALIFVLPLLSMWTSAAALAGGMFSAQNTLDIGYLQFFDKLPDAVPLVNVYIGLAKSVVFGLMIALVACHFGFRCKPNTESLGNETTNSVVAAITVVIMADAVFAILFMDVGMP